METFRTNKQYGLIDLVRETLVFIVILTIILTALHLIKSENLYNFSLVVPGVLLLMSVYDKASRKCLVGLNFDTNNKEIVFIYKTLISEVSERRIRFNNATVEVIARKPIFKIFESLTLYFLMNKKEVFELGKGKDGFAIKTLEDIVNTLKNFVFL